MRKTLRINTGNEIGKTVEKSLDEYFRRLDGEPPHGIYDMVINHVERALVASVMDRAGGNQTQAADMLGMNRNMPCSRSSHDCPSVIGRNIRRKNPSSGLPRL